MEVVQVGPFFGQPEELGRDRHLAQVLSDDTLDLGGIDLVLYLFVGAIGQFSGRMYEFQPEARDAWDALVRGRNPVLVLDHAHEGPSFQDAFSNRIRRLIQETGLPPQAIWLAQTNKRFAGRLRSSPTAARLAKQIGFIDSHSFAIAMATRAPRLGFTDLGRANIADATSHRKVFLCLNGAPRPHRAALAYTIAHHPRRDRIFITFHESAGPKIGLEAAAPLAQKLLADAGTEAGDLLDVLTHHPFDVDASPDNTYGQRNLTLSPELYHRTMASIVTETDISDASIVRYTEKALKPLLMGHPLVVVGNPHTLPLLEELGFDVFRDIIPADYDRLADPVRRFRAVLGVIDRLLEDPPAFPWNEEIRRRLLANVALFDGPLLDTLRRRERLSIEAAARRMP